MNVTRVLLDTIQNDRWRFIRQYFGTEAWWHELMSRHVFIAGGAALFVADKHQCIHDVMDINVYCAMSGAQLHSIVDSLYVIHRDSGVLSNVSVSIEGSVVVVKAMYMTMKFVRVDSTFAPERFIQRLLFTHSQFAICQSSADSNFIFRYNLLSTADARRALATRRTALAISSPRLWPFRQACLAHHVFDQIEKLARKGFQFSYRGPIVKKVAAGTGHDCSIEHVRNHQEIFPLQQVTADECNVAIFSESNLPEHPLTRLGHRASLE